MFIVVCHDRRTDLAISVHRTRAGADARIEEFKADYDDDYTWTEEDYGRDRGWLRFVATDSDEGPNARIEYGKLEP